MINHLHALAVFAKVAEAGSFRAAADHLGVTPSVASHHVTALERHLDTPLIYRTTRKLSLTSAGVRLLVSAQDMLKAAEQGLADIGFLNPNRTGRLKITAPAVLQYARFVTRISTFIMHYPMVEISINFSDRRHNLAEEGFDLGFRVGQLEDSSLIARKLATGRLVACAAPDYLAGFAAPKHPDDLRQMEMIELAGLPTTIKFSLATGTRNHQIVMRHRISVDSGFTARRMAEQGCGITVLPDFLVEQSVEQGQLVPVLPNWQSPKFGIFAMWPPNSASHHLRNSFLNFIAGITDTKADKDTIMVDK